MERGVVLVAVLTTSSDGGRDVGLCLRDSTAEIPCEVSKTTIFSYLVIVPYYHRLFLLFPVEISLHC